VAKLYFHEVVKLFGVLKNKIFWEAIWHMVSTKLKFSTTYYPQTDGQTEVVNQSFGNILQCLVVNNNMNFNFNLLTVHSEYTSVVNRLIVVSPVETMHCFF
jgi:hypothetical protein